MLPLGSRYPILSPLGHAAPPSAAATYRDKVLGYSPIAYWMLAEAAGTTAVDQVNSPAQNGTYGRDVGVMGTGTGIGDGNTAPFFDGTNDYCNVFSAALAAAYNQNTGTIMIWAKVADAGVWTDGQWRYSFGLSGAGAFRLNVWSRRNTNDILFEYYNPGGIRNYTTSSTSWLHLLCTWDTGAGQYLGYVNGAVEPAMAITGPIGTLDAALLGSYVQNPPPSYSWHGWLAHAVLWDVVLTAPQIADLATV